MSAAKEYPEVPEDQELGAELSARVINLTPHVVRLLKRRDDGGFTLLAVLEPDPRGPARVTMHAGLKFRLPLLDGTSMPLRGAPKAGSVTGLPLRATVSVPTGSTYGTTMEVRPDHPVKIYVVSALVAHALRGQGRDDCFTVSTQPDEIERMNGQVWGTYALEQVAQGVAP